ncbi:MAG TPA: catalase family protein, partial [Methylophilaceae bacterium]|nr:catalase family protein [Methylophilaceae bacterium]
MSDYSLVTPLRYDPAYENVEEDEAQTTADLIESLTYISDTNIHYCKHAMRSVHAKSHGLLRGELQVLDDLPEPYAQGIFAKPATVPVVMRLSTSPGDILDDSVSTPRGLAVKLVGVEGERLPGSQGDVTQDFVLVNGPAFMVKDAKSFVKNLQMLAKTTDRVEGLKKVFSATLRGVEKVLESVGSESATIKSMGGQPETNILGETFYSQVPIMYGPYMAKIAVAPVSPALTALTNAPLDVNGKPNGLREAVMDFFAQHEAEWEVRVQLCTDLDKMPIDDASVVWPEALSPYVPVARIRAPAQLGWSDAKSHAIDDGMAFSPWHGVAAHKPIGSIMRIRKTIYDAMAKQREQYNGKPVAEPSSLDDFPEDGRAGGEPYILPATT